MKKNHLNLFSLLTGALFFLVLFSCSEKNELIIPPEGAPVLKSGIYEGNLTYVLGDVKQAFIQNKVTTTSKADNLLTGFENLGVNGIRIPIYAEGVNPNEAMYDYFFTKAKQRGFLVFANPAQSVGGRRIANGLLWTKGESVRGITAKKNALVNRIKDFSNSYRCNWICPFNEDGAPGTNWWANQMNNIFNELRGNLHGAQLVGPCTWGIPEGIQVLNKTKVEDYSSIVTTHNLGFDHGKWNTFINKAKGKPVWDSETNYYDKYGTGTRLEAAIDAGVNGIVLYDSWKYINLSNGNINSTGNEVKSIYLK